MKTKKVKYIYNPDLQGGSFLGAGQFGKVWKGYHYYEQKGKDGKVSGKKGTPVAIKVIRLKGIEEDESKLDELIKSTMAEVNVFKQINFKVNSHPNLVNIYDIYETERNMYIVMELCGKDLNLGQYIKRRYEVEKSYISEGEAMLIIDNILQGLFWLNKYKIMQRDIK